MSELTSDELRQYMNFRMGGMTAYRKREIQKILNIAIDRAEAAERNLATVQSAAHMPSGYPYGLPSWINQHLYAAYIGAQFPIPVMERIRKGQLTFPEAPVYTELAQAQARIADLEAQAAQAWRPMETVPDGEDVELLVHGYIGDDGLWYYRDGTTPLKGWRPID